MNKIEKIEMVIIIVLACFCMMLLSGESHAADLSLDYEKSSLKGSYNSFFNSMSTRRIGAELSIPLSKSVVFSVAGGQEKFNYVYYYGYTFLNQILMLEDGTVVGARGPSIYYRQSDSLVGPYFKFRLCMKL